MERALEQMTQASQQVAAVLYHSASAEGGNGAPGGESAPGGEGATAGADDDVIDAEYVDVDAEEES